MKLKRLALNVEVLKKLTYPQDDGEPDPETLEQEYVACCQTMCKRKNRKA